MKHKGFFIILAAFVFTLNKASGQSADPYLEKLNQSIRFTENKGQLVDMDEHQRPDILFKAEGGGAGIYLRKTGFSYVLSNAGEIYGRLHELKKQNHLNNLPMLETDYT